MYAYTKQSNCRQNTVAYPLEVFKYAVKHDYLDLGDEAAIGTISLSLDEVNTEARLTGQTGHSLRMGAYIRTVFK
jgi:hypothetical protein